MHGLHSNSNPGTARTGYFGRIYIRYTSVLVGWRSKLSHCIRLVTRSQVRIYGVGRRKGEAFVRRRRRRRSTCDHDLMYIHTKLSLSTFNLSKSKVWSLTHTPTHPSPLPFPLPLGPNALSPGVRREGEDVSVSVHRSLRRTTTASGRISKHPPPPSTYTLSCSFPPAVIQTGQERGVSKLPFLYSLLETGADPRIKHNPSVKSLAMND
jgi:hypothetical protein